MGYTYQPMLWLLPAFAAPPGTAVAPTDAPVVVDGVLDESAWANATPVTNFGLFRPINGGPPPGTTDVRFLQDDRYLYVGVRVLDAGYPIRARISARERINADDQVGIYLDTFGDERSGYIFYFNALGIQQDIRFNNGSWNPNWNTVYKSRGRVVEDGFELEIAFPWRSLKYPRSEDPQTWGLMVTRKIPSQGYKYGHPIGLERGHPQWFSQAAPLTNVQPQGSSGLEIIPQITTRQVWSRDALEDPLEASGFQPWNDTIRPSLDIRYGITPNIGLAGTVNPDFSQVENDITPIALNQRFAFFFPERREFFLDGIGYFEDTPKTLYTRSLVAPAYGLKISGKEGPWAVGLLQAIDTSPAASVHEQETPGFSSEELEGTWAENAYLRVRRDIGNNGTFGLTVADKRIIRTEDRSLPAHYTGVAMDAVIPLQDRWVMQAVGGASIVGSESALAPLTGTDRYIGIKRASGQGTGVSAFVTDRTPGFRQEMGFLNQSGLLTGGGSIDHTFENAGPFDSFRPSLEVVANHERNGDYFRAAMIEQRLQRGVHFLNLSAAVQQQSDAGFALDDMWSLDASYRADLTRFLYIKPQLHLERTIDFNTLRPAQISFADLETTLRPTAGIRIDGLFRVERLAPEELMAQLATRARLRIQWQFTKELGLRTILEHTAGTERNPQLLSSLLLNWLLYPGTAAWLGYVETTDLSGGPTPLDRSIFAKVSFLFRP